MVRRINAKEAAEQEALFDWAEACTTYFPELKLMYHIPNGGYRNKAEAARLKVQGVKAGVPDIHLPVARGKYHSLYIELKAGNNKPTENQKIWLRELNKQGNAVSVCYGWHQAAETIKHYLNLNEKEKENE